jgi:hypothetical protein
MTHVSVHAAWRRGWSATVSAARVVGVAALALSTPCVIQISLTLTGAEIERAETSGDSGLPEGKRHIAQIPFFPTNWSVARIQALARTLADQQATSARTIGPMLPRTVTNVPGWSSAEFSDAERQLVRSVWLDFQSLRPGSEAGAVSDDLFSGFEAVKSKQELLRSLTAAKELLQARLSADRANALVEGQLTRSEAVSALQASTTAGESVPLTRFSDLLWRGLHPNWIYSTFHPSPFRFCGFKQGKLSSDQRSR